MEREKREYVRFYITIHQRFDYQRNKHKNTCPDSTFRHTAIRQTSRERGFPATPNGLFGTPEEPVSHTGTAFPATRKSAIGMPTTVKQWNNGVITARQHVQNGGVTYRQSQGGTCKTVHFIGVRQLTGKAERHLGTLKRDATYVKSVKRERHCHSLQQYFISTSQPPFSGIINVASACRD